MSVSTRRVRKEKVIDAVRALVQRFIIASPFARSLAVEPLAIDADRVCVRMPFAPERTTIGEMVHGGAIAALVDIAATAACWANDEIAPGSRGTTVGFSIQFLNAALASELVAVGNVVQRGRSLCTAQVIVRNRDENEVARATVTYKLDAPRAATPPADPAAAMAALFADRQPAEQAALLARLERAGAALYTAMAANESNAPRKQALLAAAAREIENAHLLETPS